MPNYTYTDGETEIIVSHSINWDGEIISGSGVRYWRKPPVNVAVNWGGLPPHRQHEQSAEIKNHIDTVDQQRDDYRKRKEERGKK